jgi:hypothetical protein
MARKRKKSSKKSMKGKCKIVTVCGKRRRLCFGKKGITSNRPASGGTKRRKSTKKRKSSKRKAGTCKFGRARSGKCYKSAKSAKAGRKARRRAA